MMLVSRSALLLAVGIAMLATSSSAAKNSKKDATEAPVWDCENHQMCPDGSAGSTVMFCSRVEIQKRGQPVRIQGVCADCSGCQDALSMNSKCPKRCDVAPVPVTKAPAQSTDGSAGCAAPLKGHQYCAVLEKDGRGVDVEIPCKKKNKKKNKNKPCFEVVVEAVQLDEDFYCKVDGTCADCCLCFKNEDSFNDKCPSRCRVFKSDECGAKPTPSPATAAPTKKTKKNKNKNKNKKTTSAASTTIGTTTTTTITPGKDCSKKLPKNMLPDGAESPKCKNMGDTALCSATCEDPSMNILGSGVFQCNDGTWENNCQFSCSRWLSNGASKFMYLESRLAANNEGTVDFNQAEKRCEAYGGSLVSLADEEESAFVGSLSQDNKQRWIGGERDRQGESMPPYSWTWTDGSKFDILTQTNYKDLFSPNEPNDYNLNENCLIIGRHKNGIVGWNDVPCTSKRQFICKKKNSMSKCSGAEYVELTTTTTTVTATTAPPTTTTLKVKKTKKPNKMTTTTTTTTTKKRGRRRRRNKKPATTTTITTMPPTTVVPMPAQSTPIYINVGGPRLELSGDVTWQAGSDYTSGPYTLLQDMVNPTNFAAGELYETALENSETTDKRFKILVPLEFISNYYVTFFFGPSRQKRVFGLDINGVEVVRRYSISDKEKPSQTSILVKDVNQIEISLNQYIKDKAGFLNAFTITKTSDGCPSNTRCKPSMNAIEFNEKNNDMFAFNEKTSPKFISEYQRFINRCNGGDSSKLPSERSVPANGFQTCAWVPPSMKVLPDLRTFQVAKFTPDQGMFGPGDDIIFGLRIGRRQSAEPWSFAGQRFNIPAQACWSSNPDGDFRFEVFSDCNNGGDFSANAIWSIDFSVDLGGRLMRTVDKDYAVELRIRGDYSSDVLLFAKDSKNILLNPHILFNEPLTLWQGSFPPNTLFNSLAKDKSNPFSATKPGTFYITLALVDRATGLDVFGVDIIVDAVTPSEVKLPLG